MLKIIYSISVVLIALGMVVITYILRKKFLEKQVMVKEAKSDIPDDVNPDELSYLYHNIVKNEYFNSILLSLANKGYIRVEETGLKDANTNLESYRITKLKEYEDNNINEKMYLKEIIQYGLNGVSVLSSDLFGNVGTTTSEIKKNIATEYKDKVYESFMSGPAKWIVIMIFIILFLAFLIPVIMPMDMMYLISGIIGFACMGLVGYWGKDLKARTGYGIKVLEEIESFKKYLENRDNEQIANELNNNPNYFYEMLPYAYALGITDSFIEKFNGVNIQEPYWYKAKDEFKMQNLIQFINLLKELK